MLEGNSIMRFWKTTPEAMNLLLDSKHINAANKYNFVNYKSFFLQKKKSHFLTSNYSFRKHFFHHQYSHENTSNEELGRIQDK